VITRVTKVGVTVTFLRMDDRPREACPPLPDDVKIVVMRAPPVSLYRYLYNTVGEDYLWWLRRVLSDPELARILNSPALTLHVLYKDDAPAGFFELDRGPWPDVNLSYFGLMPHMIGRGVGFAFLCRAVDEVWRGGAGGMTVNTCTADHPRALPNYLRAGFYVVRQVKETWSIPNYLNMRIPPALRA
jgi:GNAT superfamily N-acetyltransferase